jgi:transcriptional repressor NF-X1
MGEDEDEESTGKGPSKNSVPRARPFPKPKSHSNASSPQGHPSRPNRPQRQRRTNVAESSTATNAPSNLNPSAPAFVPQQPTAPSAANENAGPSTNAPANRNRRDGRRGRNYRQTAATEKKAASSETHSQSRPTGPPRQPRKPGNTNSRVQTKIIKESEDLMSRMTESLTKGEYDCSICTDSVFSLRKYSLTGQIQRYKPIWSCKTCWAVFHKSCIQKWAAHSLGEGPLWRCPGCQTPSETVPNEYRCWCGKVENPDVDHLATPHSCTQPCLRKRKSGCACVLPCHPGTSATILGL